MSKSNEQPATVDVDAMSDDELDSFLEEHTGIDAEAMENSDVIDEPEERETPPVEELPETEVKPVEEEEEEEEIPAEEEVVVPSEEEGEETISPKYTDDELGVMSEVYEDLFKNGIKASGMERTVRDPEHLKTLVRIGFSANENNRRIKPYLKQLKSLEQAGVSLEDDNLNFLVDVMNGNKDAIKELVKNRLGMEEEELQTWYDDEGKTTYVPKDHVISDSRFQLQEILEEIKSTPTYDKTVNFIGNVDDDGKVLISENPELVNLLNDDMQSGVFDKAMDEAQFRMDRGLLPKQSILQSYIQVMQDETFYNGLTGVETTPEATTKEVVTDPNKKKEVVSRKKRASNVGTSKGSTSGSSTKNIQSKDINKMSDEEFEEFYNALDMDD